MKTMVVQRRLPYQPEQLDKKAAEFMAEVRRLVREVREKYAAGTLELTDIGFVPAEQYIEVRLYFNVPTEAVLDGRSVR